MEGYDQLTDSQLIDAIQQGDSPAFDVLQLRYEKEIYRSILWKIKDVYEAEDLKQETFLRAFEHISSNQYQDKNFKGWLYTIADNLVKDYFKRYGRVAPPKINEIEPEEVTAKAFLETEPDTRPLSDEQVIGKEQLVFIETVLNEFLIENQPTDEKKRRGELKKIAFYLFVIDKLDIPEIQEELMPVAQNWGIKLPDSFFKNWKRDILKPFCNHVVEKYPSWIQELIREESLKKSLTETEYALISLLWEKRKTLSKVAKEMKVSIDLAQSLFEQAKEKIKKELVKALGGRIKRK